MHRCKLNLRQLATSENPYLGPEMSIDNDSNAMAAERAMPPLTHDVLARWKLEIRDFFATTQRKLNQLREALPQSYEPKQPVSVTRSMTGEYPPTHDATAADESLDRLQAIKRRLAAQLGNSQG